MKGKSIIYCNRKKINIEMREQMAFVKMIEINYPFLHFTISTAGVKLSLKTYDLLKKMGYRKGTPDIFIFEPKGKYHGLFIELKSPKNLISEKGKIMYEQKIFLQESEKRNYKTVVAYGAHDAYYAVKDYLNLEMNKEGIIL